MGKKWSYSVESYTVLYKPYIYDYRSILSSTDARREVGVRLHTQSLKSKSIARDQYLDKWSKHLAGISQTLLSCRLYKYIRWFAHGDNFMAIFTTLSVVIWFSTGTLGIFATFFYVFTMRVVIYDILSIAIIRTLSTSILFCNLCYIILWISPRSVKNK